ncbi:MULTISPECIES: P1 family peptidase [unclassified Stappia]|uniref:DmpA family aminopeptidase n=1 Tax=unclassified Stappia TaxID=2629676 RepID=UPI0016439F5A|nr:MULTISPECIES: P1 family peptidase [unclassified Stappia]
MTARSAPLKPRARDLGLDLPGCCGPFNAITDVPGVLVGFKTLQRPAGSGTPPVLTGVTAILPRGFDTHPSPVWAGQYTLNGNGEMTGSHWVRDAGHFLGPLVITNTHSVGIAHHAATRWILSHHAEAFARHHLWAMPVIAETYDGVLSDINGQHVGEDDVLAAIGAAVSGPVAEGNVGGGAGMICYEFKGGTGTSSRRLAVAGEDFTLGVLVQANHGHRPWLTVLGAPVGRHLERDRIAEMPSERGSIIAVIATDLPLGPSQLERLARRAALGIGRGGTPGGNSSGDIFLAFSTANRMDLPQLSGPWRDMRTLNDELLDPVYLAAVEAVDEAVLNAMLAAEDAPTAKPAGHVCRALPVKDLLAVLARYGRAPLTVPASTPAPATGR